MKILALLLSLTILVASHELGHLLFAKLFKTRVNRYYIFFNWKFSIFKAKKFDGKWHFLWFNAETPQEWIDKEPDNTLWGLGWIPLGGYCDIAGMIDETKSAEGLPSEPQPWEYRTKPAWQRLLIISGGVLVNFVSALLIYSCIFAHWGKDELPLRNANLGYEYHQILLDEGFENGDILWALDGVEMFDFAEAQQKLLLDNPKVATVMRGDSLVDLTLSDSIISRVNRERPNSLMAIRSPFVIKDFMAGSPAHKAGMMAGDSVVSINGESTPSYSEIFTALSENKGKAILVGFFREGKYMEQELTLDNNGKMGVQLKTPIETFNVQHTDYTFIQAIPAGIKYGVETLTNYVSSLKVIFTKDGAQNLGGFGTLGSLFPQEWNWFQFWNITALLAVILAFMNVISIPGLDGGHILFTLWEIVTRKKPGDKFLEYAQNVGMILLLILLLWANGNDLWRWISGMMR